MDKKLKIKQNEIRQILNIPEKKNRKYVSPLLNLANRFSKATSPKVVGQMSDLFREFLKEEPNPSIDKWANWYLSKHKNEFNEAFKKIKAKVNEFKETLENLNDEEIKDWLYDLIINKTFEGLYVQILILKKVSTTLKCHYRLANQKEESKGIDAILLCKDKEIAVQIKPSSFKAEKQLTDKFTVPILFYEKTKDGIIVDISQLEDHLKSNG